jgi:type I restriction enzyme S subunit
MTEVSEVQRLKYAVVGCVNGIWGDEPNGEDDLVVVRVADFDRERCSVILGDSPTTRAVPERVRERRLLKRGDLLVEKSGGGEQQPVGNVVLFDQDVQAVCSNFVARMPVAPDCDSRFLAYVFRALYVEGRNLPHVKQTSGIQNLDSESYLNERVWLPAKSTQKRIASYLDEQTGRIDALIAEKERLIERLEELRLSRIYEYLSGGMDGASRKHTGDEWFPAVPDHWSFCALNYRYEVELGKMLDEKKQSGANPTPYLRNADVRWDYVNTDDLPAIDIAEGERHRYTVDTGDLLVCEGGAGVGRTAIWTGPSGVFAFQKALHRLRPRQSTEVPRYILYLMRDAVARGRVLGHEKATIPHLTAEAFRRWRIPFPPAKEQARIVAALDQVSDRCDELDAHCRAHIERLREYRSSLISAAVAGDADFGSEQGPEQRAS